MQPPSGERTDRLVVVPEADRIVRLPKEPVQRTTLVALIAVLLAAAILATAVTTYAIERGHVTSAERASTAAQNASKAAEAAATERVGALRSQVQATINSLNGEIASLKDAATSARTGAALQTGARDEAQRLVATLQQRLRATRSLINSVTGPPLTNGTYVGLIDAVGAGESPPRVIIDPVHLYTGKAATQAAVHDGFIKPGGTLPHGRYFRNPTSAWRILAVSAAAQLVLRGWRGSASTVLSLTELEDVFSSSLPANEEVTRAPFVVEVSGGQITALRELLYP